MHLRGAILTADKPRLVLPGTISVTLNDTPQPAEAHEFLGISLWNDGLEFEVVTNVCSRPDGLVDAQTCYSSLSFRDLRRDSFGAFLDYSDKLPTQGRGRIEQTRVASMIWPDLRLVYLDCIEIRLAQTEAGWIIAVDGSFPFQRADAVRERGSVHLECLASWATLFLLCGTFSGLSPRLNVMRQQGIPSIPLPPRRLEDLRISGPGNFILPGRLETCRGAKTTRFGAGGLVVTMHKGGMVVEGIHSFELQQNGVCRHLSDRGPTLTGIASDKLAGQLDFGHGRCTIVENAPNLGTLQIKTFMGLEPGDWANRINQAICHRETEAVEEIDGIHLTIRGKLSGYSDFDIKRFSERERRFLELLPPIEGFFLDIVLPWSYLYVTGSELFMQAYRRAGFDNTWLRARVFPPVC